MDGSRKRSLVGVSVVSALIAVVAISFLGWLTGTTERLDVDRRADSVDHALRESAEEFRQSAIRESDRWVARGLTVERCVVDARSPDERSRVRALQALGEHAAAGRADEGIRVLVEVLGSSVSIQTRAVAAQALGRYGARAAPAAPVLVSALEDERLRDLALGAIGSIGPGATSALPRLLEIAADESVRPASRCRAIAALASVDVSVDASGTLLARLARGAEDRRVRHAASVALGVGSRRLEARLR